MIWYHIIWYHIISYHVYIYIYIYHPMKMSIYLDPLRHRQVPPVFLPGYVEGTFTVLSPRSVAYLDFTGSGSETIAHSMQQLGSAISPGEISLGEWRFMKWAEQWQKIWQTFKKTLVGSTRFLEGTKLVGLLFWRLWNLTCCDNIWVATLVPLKWARELCLRTAYWGGWSPKCEVMICMRNNYQQFQSLFQKELCHFVVAFCQRPATTGIKTILNKWILHEEVCQVAMFFLLLLGQWFQLKTMIGDIPSVDMSDVMIVVHVFWHRLFIPALTDFIGASTMSLLTGKQTSSMLLVLFRKCCLHRWRCIAIADITHCHTSKDSQMNSQNLSSTYQNTLPIYANHLGYIYIYIYK